ncbi:MAG: hypothetical protein WAO55_05900 [Candidatus Manganitrophaceae bacterium]
MKMPGFNAETSLYRPALMIRPDPVGLEGGIVVGEDGEILYAKKKPNLDAYATCVYNCIQRNKNRAPLADVASFCAEACVPAL